MATLDAARIASLREVDPHLVRDLAALFTTETRAHLETLRSALAGGDVEAISFIAHSVKGAAANLGATELAARCQQLDNAAQGGDMALGPLIDVVEQEYTRVEAALEREIQG